MTAFVIRCIGCWAESARNEDGVSCRDGAIQQHGHGLIDSAAKETSGKEAGYLWKDSPKDYQRGWTPRQKSLYGKEVEWQLLAEWKRAYMLEQTPALNLARVDACLRTKGA
eukprot:5454616-Pleurochrysis_carterae.AAC.1